jgi:uncharacterized protein
MITPEELRLLIQFRFDQAHTAERSAELLVQNGDPRGALNRIYYAMFYAVLALGVHGNFETSKHGQLIGWFNRDFIKSNIFDARLSQILREAFERRTIADYDFRGVPSEEEIEAMVADMKLFIATIKDYLEAQLRQG